MNVRLFKPSLGQEEIDNIKDSFDQSWVGLGPKVSEFENRWADFVGSESAIAVNSATAALHLALASFKFPEGKKVLLPAQTFAATATAILYNRLVPVFVDSDKITLGMDIHDMMNKYDKDVVAVIPVHYAGHPMPMELIMPWAEEKNIRVIEDCAHTAGGVYKGKMLGTWGDIGCYSFEEKKLMTTGDGGMLVTNEPEILSDVKAMRWVGIDKDNWKTSKKYLEKDMNAYHWFYEINVLGYKYNMNDLAASIGLAQLKKLESFNKKRSNIISQYMKGLSNISGISLLVPYQPEKYPYQMFGIRVDARDELILHLKGKGIATGCHYTPLTRQPLFKEYASECNYIETEADRMITLPLHAELTKEEVSYVIKSIKEFY